MNPQSHKHNKPEGGHVTKPMQNIASVSLRLSNLLPTYSPLLPPYPQEFPADSLFLHHRHRSANPSPPASLPLVSKRLGDF